MFSLREDLNFDISKLSRRRSSKLEFERQEEMIVKSSAEMWWRDWCAWARALEREFVASFIPVRGETSICSEIRVWKCWRVWPKYNALQHWHELKLRNYVPLVFHTLPCVSSSSQADDCHVSSFKDRIPKLMRSRITYKYSCQCCRALYFGQTRQHFHTRISEHMEVSPLTGMKLAN